MPSAVDIISRFYNNEGWEQVDGITEDAKRYEDLRKCARKYISKCRLRLLKYIPLKGENFLDLGSGPIQYPEYLEYSRNFSKRYCVDLSSKALEEAKKKLGNRGEYFCGSFFDIELKKNSFDCAVTLHTIYHMDKNMQDRAIRKLISLVKPGKPLIIVYSNPFSLEQCIMLPLRLLKNLSKFFINLISRKFGRKDGLVIEKYYFRPFNLEWWERFKDIAEIRIKPWRTFGVRFQKLLFPNNFIGKIMFDKLYKMEQKFPKFFNLIATYPMIILIKK